MPQVPEPLDTSGVGGERKRMGVGGEGDDEAESEIVGLKTLDSILFCRSW